MKQPLIVIAGPTATGKSKLAVSLAQKIGGEIISADSMQVYKYMNIGTAKSTTAEMGGIKHHMIDVLLPDDEFSVAVFKEMSIKCIQEVHKKGKIPILVGGTGFYINAVLYNNDFTETTVCEEYRNELYSIAEKEGNEYLHAMLKKIDTKSAESIHFNNVKRVVRAIEFFKQTNGQKMSEHNEHERKRDAFFDTTFVVLNMERSLLYEKINLRVDNMIEAGLLNEVESLLNMGYDEKLVSMQGIGYKEIAGYINGSHSFSEAVEAIKLNTRRFAKRQVTWFKNQTEGLWIDMDKTSQDLALEKILTECKKHNEFL